MIMMEPNLNILGSSFLRSNIGSPRLDLISGDEAVGDDKFREDIELDDRYDNTLGITII